MLNANRQVKKWELNYEHDLILAYWLSIQMEDIRVASSLVNFDTSLRYITCLAIKGKKECKYTDVKIDYRKEKNPKSILKSNITSNDASITPTPRSEPKSPLPTNQIGSPMDKSMTSALG